MTPIFKAVVATVVVMTILYIFIIAPAHQAWRKEAWECRQQGKTPIISSHGEVLACIKEYK